MGRHYATPFGWLLVDSERGITQALRRPGETKPYAQRHHSGGLRGLGPQGWTDSDSFLPAHATDAELSITIVLNRLEELKRPVPDENLKTEANAGLPALASAKWEERRVVPGAGFEPACP